MSKFFFFEYTYGKYDKSQSVIKTESMGTSSIDRICIVAESKMMLILKRGKKEEASAAAAAAILLFPLTIYSHSNFIRSVTAGYV